MAGTNIKRDLPNDEYNAAVNANSPSATNPFATIADETSIYSEDGTIAVNRLVQIQNGLIWSGSTILRTTNNMNVKEVIQESDLGTTLAANTVYLIRGKVTVSQPISVINEGSVILGTNRETDNLEYTGATGNLFNVSDVNFTISHLKLSSTRSGTGILRADNITAGQPNVGRLKVLSIDNCQFRNCYDVMDISGFDLVDINQCLFIYVEATDYGLRFEDVSKLQITSCELIRWFDEATIAAPSGFATVSMIELQDNNLASYGAVNINGCIIHPQQNQNGIDIGAGSTTGFGTISSNAFVNGNLLGEVFLPVVSPGLPNYSAAETIGYDVFANQGLLNSVSGTVMTLTGNTNDTTLSSGVPAIINTNGAVTQQAGVRYTVTGAGRATYTGKKQVYVSIHASISYEKQGNGADDYKFYIYKNGALLPGAVVDILVDDDASTALPMVYGTLMSTSDYIEFYVENPTGNDAMLVKDFQVVIRE
jgi:hypothetical protein